MRNISLIAMLLVSIAASVHTEDFPPCERLCQTCGNEKPCMLLQNGQRAPMLKHVKGISGPTPYVIALMREGISKPVNYNYVGYYIPPVPFKGVTQGLHDHNAVDFRCSYGTPVVAAAAGRICETGFNTIAGRYIVIEHDNGTETRYAHLSKEKAVKGQKIRQGEVIGLSGDSGNATAPHLHFSVRGRHIENPFAHWPVAG